MRQSLATATSLVAMYRSEAIAPAPTNVPNENTVAPTMRQWHIEFISFVQADRGARKRSTVSGVDARPIVPDQHRQKQTPQAIAASARSMRRAFCG